MKRMSLALVVLSAVAFAACSTTSKSRTSAESTEVIPLKHVDAVGAATQLESEFGDARIVADTRTNAIIVMGSPAELAQVRRAVNRIDQPG
jgi:type II secretory pathway component GspD/PulD (secretin)